MLNRALLVVDYIKGISAGNGTCAGYLQDHPEVIENTNALINAARSHQIPIFHIRLAFNTDYTGLPKYAPSTSAIRNNQRFHLNSEATEFIPDIQQMPTDTIVNKSYGDVFQGNQLIQQLKNQGIEQIFYTPVFKGGITHDFYYYTKTTKD